MELPEGDHYGNRVLSADLTGVVKVVDKKPPSLEAVNGRKSDSDLQGRGRERKKAAETGDGKATEKSPHKKPEH